MALLRSMEVPAGLAPILLPGERLVTAVRAHWAKLAEPVATATLALSAAVWVDSNVTTYRPDEAVSSTDSLLRRRFRRASSAA